MEKLISEFYTAFDQLDAEKMVSLYHDEIEFEDPAFGKLKGERAKNMWRMLCSSQTKSKFDVSYTLISSDMSIAKAKWEAKYTFGPTGRKVHNRINANFEFKDGLIIKHTDTFPLYKWSKQALGLKGVLIGWTGFFRKKLNSQTTHLLDKFENKDT